MDSIMRSILDKAGFSHKRILHVFPAVDDNSDDHSDEGDDDNE